MNRQLELESISQSKPVLAPTWENTKCTTFWSNMEEKKNEQKLLTEEWKAACWKYRANSEAWGEPLFLFWFFLGPHCSTLLASKFSAWTENLSSPPSLLCLYPTRSVWPAPKPWPQTLLLALRLPPAQARALQAFSRHVQETELSSLSRSQPFRPTTEAIPATSSPSPPK